MRSIERFSLGVCRRWRVASVLPAVVWVLSGVFGLSAFQLTPMAAVIDPARATPTTTFEVTNGGEAPVAIELRASTRSIDADGTELNDDASDQIQVFPSQIVLRPGASQTIRARWIGDAIPDRELPFRITAEQLPINLRREQNEASGVQFMLRYRATLYVRPPGTTPDIEVTGIDTSDPERVTLVVRNNGTRHQLFSRGTIVLIGSDGDRQELSLEDFEQFLGINVLAGETRRLHVPRDQLPLEPAEVRFRFN